MKTTGLFLRGRARDALGQDDRAALEGAIREVVELPTRRTIIRAGERVRSSTYLIEGFVGRYIDDREGHRQLVTVHVPGDFVDLHGFALLILDHDLVTIGPARVALFDHGALETIERERPKLARLLWFSTLLDAAMHRQWIFRLGRLDAEARVAAFLCEMKVRLEMVGMGEGDRFALPFTQSEIGEACGVTGIHVNRTLRSLREQELATIREGEAVIHDFAKLARRGEFDPHYLYPDMSALLREDLSDQ